MQTSDTIDQLRSMGIALAALPNGMIGAGPQEALTDEARALIRHHKPALLAALSRPTRAYRVYVTLPDGTSPRWITMISSDRGLDAATRTATNTFGTDRVQDVRPHDEQPT